MHPILPTVSNLYRYYYPALDDNRLRRIIRVEPNENTIHYRFDNLNINEYYVIYAHVEMEPVNHNHHDDDHDDDHDDHDDDKTDDVPVYNGMAGWYSNVTCGWLTPVYLSASQPVVSDLNMEVTGTTALFHNMKRTHPFGSLKLIKNYPVLQLWGSPEQRGNAHGYIVAEQIMDFFRYFVLRATAADCEMYERYVVPKLMNRTLYFYSNDYLREASAILDGMKQSGIDLYVKELKRNLSLVDIFAINGYGDVGYWISQFKESQRNHLDKKHEQPLCSQVSIWSTESSNGLLISGRNMDGELDAIRKVTVSHLMMFAIDPREQSDSQEGKYRYVSIMWPGFIGTSSGLNEHGLYVMENSGQTHDGLKFSNTSFAATIIRSILSSVSGKNASPKTIEEYFTSQYQLKTGGVCARGCNLFFATPYFSSLNSSAAFVYEGDFMGGVFRVGGDAEPRELPNALVATNHFLKYGWTELEPNYNFGHEIPQSSLWRYAALANNLRSTATNPIQPRDSDYIIRLLQTASESETEHSIVYKPNIKNNQLLFSVAVASQSMTKGWNAPYTQWTDFEFEELFNSRE
jgi:hypothetical protein